MDFKKIFKGALALGLVGSSLSFGQFSEVASAQEEEVSIEVWLTPQFMGVNSADEEGADYDSFHKEAAARFQEEYPNVNIDIQVIPGSDRDSELSVALQTDTLPDVFFDSSFVLSQWAHEGVLAPLDDAIDEESRSDIPETIWDNVMINDQTYMYPFNHNVGTLVYNADMFREAGLEDYIGDEHGYATWTMEDYNTILETLREYLPEGQSPMSLFALDTQGDTWNLNWLRMYGNEFWGEDGQLIVNEENGVQALQQLVDWKDAGYTNAGPESVSSNDMNALFQNQQVAISFTNSILFNNMFNSMANGEIQEFDARLALNPSANEDPIAFTYVLSSVVFNTGTEAEVQAAKDFVQFYSSDEELTKASAQGIPVRDSVAESLSSEDYPFLEANQEITAEVYNFSNNTPGYAQLRNLLYPELQAAFTGAKTPQEAMDSYVEQGNAAIQSETESSAVLQE
ncbi:carbohydrate ABC transporter substrate-binding protein [Aerococcaceae bacterium DSM 111022]|nr:carbohydrate ABC transporter substrate-binding protein [Aerococcaceae bacterium DSM 111022]